MLVVVVFVVVVLPVVVVVDRRTAWWQPGIFFLPPSVLPWLIWFVRAGVFGFLSKAGVDAW